MLQRWTRQELAEAWHDWIRGLLLVLVVAVFAILHLTRAVSPVSLAFSLALVVSVGLWVVLMGYCSGNPAPAWARVLTPVLALVAVVLLLGLARELLFPAPALLQGEMSFSQPELKIVSDGPPYGAFVNIKGTPGVLPSGKDREITGRLALRQTPYYRLLTFDLARPVSKGPPGRSGGNTPPKIAATSRSYFVDSLPPGEVQMILSNYRPQEALPVHVSVHPVRIPMLLFRIALSILLGLSILLVPMFPSASVFPYLVPFLAALAGAGWATTAGLSLEDPVLPFLGMLFGAGIPSAGTGYVLAWLVRRLSRRGKPTS